MGVDVQAVKQRVAPYLYFGSLYFITVGVLYLWGYWGRFDINILEYIGLADVLKLAAYPIASTFLFFLLGAIIGELLAGGQDIAPGAGRDTKVGRFLRRFGTAIVWLYMVGTASLLVFGPESKWQVAPILVAMPFYLVAKRHDVLIDILPNESARSVVIYLLAVLPMWAYGHGRLDATKLIEGREYKYVASHSIAGMSFGDPKDVKNRVKYVGHVNDYLFLLLPDNATLFIVPFEKTGGLQLRSYKTSEPALAEESNNRMQPTPKSGAADAKR
jgi:hypothetical protein